jgi:hypothetical protein
MQQAVSLRFPTVTTLVRSQVGLFAICHEQSDTGAVFLPVLLFPLPIIIPLTVPRSLITVSSEECRLLGCGAVWVYYKPMFRTKMSPPSSGQKKYASEEKCYTVANRLTTVRKCTEDTE